MAVFFLSYDLRKQRNYQPLYDELNRLNGIRVLESVWSLSLTDDTTCVQVKDHFLGFIDGDDGIIAIKASDYSINRVLNRPHPI